MIIIISIRSCVAGHRQKPTRRPRLAEPPCRSYYYKGYYSYYYDYYYYYYSYYTYYYYSYDYYY